MSGSAFNRLRDDAALCLVFFTRLPLPALDFRGRTLAQAIWAAPAAGLAVALLAGLTFWLATKFGLATAPAAALALAASLLASGGLHEDGLSDVADGFGGGATRERRLEIMRDSRIGSYGAAALVLSLLLRWSALAELAGPGHVLAALIAAHAASRGLLGAFLHLLPAARADGLSAGAGTVERNAALGGILLGAAALLLLGASGFLAAILLLAVIFAGFRLLCLNRIGGQTGDTAGALQQFAEIAILLLASVSLT